MPCATPCAGPRPASAPANSAPRSPDAEKVRQEIYKLEYLHDRQKQAAALGGAWKASNGQTFKLLLDGSRLARLYQPDGSPITTVALDSRQSGGATRRTSVRLADGTGAAGEIFGKLVLTVSPVSQG